MSCQIFITAVMSQIYSLLPSWEAMTGKALTEQMQTHGRWCLLRPVRTDQSEPTGLLRRRALKRHEFKQSIQSEGEQRCCSNGQY